MLKLLWLFHIFFLCFLGFTGKQLSIIHQLVLLLTFVLRRMNVFNASFSFVFLAGAGQESIELLYVYDSTPGLLPAASHSGLPLAVPVSEKNLDEISSSVIMAESWLRTYVLPHYPATKITTIVVGNNLFCQKQQDHNLGLILPSLKNMYHSLKRWGLENEIKVSPAFSSSCFIPDLTLFRDDLIKQVIKPLLQFLHTANSTYSIIPPPKLSPLSDKTTIFASSYLESMKKLGFLTVNKINVLIQNPKGAKTMSRKLSAEVIDTKIINPYPARPTPLPEITPIHSSIGFSIPAHAAKTPQSPQPYSAPAPLSFPSSSPPPFAIPSAAPPPFTFPSSSPPPFSFPSDSPPPMPFSMAPELPPCNPIDYNVAPAPAAVGVVQRLWCVAKPNVPADTLQEAMDYACGEGGADCEEIMPHGNCFYPDTVVAHASYAFNSYWQKTKRNGGTCAFGGTAMLINADPSKLLRN